MSENSYIAMGLARRGAPRRQTAAATVSATTTRRTPRRRFCRGGAPEPGKNAWVVIRLPLPLSFRITI